MSTASDRVLKKLHKFPLGIFILFCFICSFGFMVLYSAAKGNMSPWAIKQLAIFLGLLPVMILVSFIDIKIVYNYAIFIYSLTIIFLLVAILAGTTSMGATRWIDLGIIRIQPSEIAKISTVIMLAKFLNDTEYHKINNPYKLFLALLIIIIPSALIIKQPDLGTGIITILVGVIMIFAAGVRLSYFIFSGLITCALIPLVWSMMHNYQKQRVLTFLNPELDPLGSGYNIIQSKIAIGSGGMLGKGFLSGTQSHLSFLPEYQTDFIFSFLTEELGFVGGIFLLFLYSILITLSLAISATCRSKFAKFLVIGITSIFFSHIFINIAMVMGLLPVVGVPLPLISYGGTMLATMMLGFALILNAGMNQHVNV